MHAFSVLKAVERKNKVKWVECTYVTCESLWFRILANEPQFHSDGACSMVHMTSTHAVEWICFHFICETRCWWRTTSLNGIYEKRMEQVRCAHDYQWRGLFKFHTLETNRIKINYRLDRMVLWRLCTDWRCLGNSHSQRWVDWIGRKSRWSPLCSCKPPVKWECMESIDVFIANSIR